MKKIILVLLPIILFACTGYPTKDTLHKMNVEKQALVVGNVKLRAADSRSISLPKLRLFVKDMRTGLGKSLHNTHTQPLNSQGYFAFALPEGDWELNKFYYSTSYTSGNYVHTTIVDIPLNLDLSVQANTVVNVGELEIIAREYDKKLIQKSNLQFISKFINELPINDSLKNSPLINLFKEN